MSDAAIVDRLRRVETEQQRLFDGKASRREVDALAEDLRSQRTRLEEVADDKADKADVGAIRGDLDALRRAIVGGAISICVAVLASAAGYYLFTAHP